MKRREQKENWQRRLKGRKRGRDKGVREKMNDENQKTH